jgi:hypothetical protein
VLSWNFAVGLVPVNEKFKEITVMLFPVTAATRVVVVAEEMLNLAKWTDPDCVALIAYPLDTVPRRGGQNPPQLSMMSTIL